jgi:catechol 2,3-dioxygenase
MPFLAGHSRDASAGTLDATNTAARDTNATIRASCERSFACREKKRWSGVGMVKVRQLGHVVLQVSDLERSERFYTDVLGLEVSARMESPTTTFFTLGNHHDFAISAIGPDAVEPSPKSPGLAHVAFKIGDSTDELRQAKDDFDALGIEIEMIADHTVSQSIYITDPDGNWIELYVDVSDVWRTDPQAVATVAPLAL